MGGREHDFERLRGPIAHLRFRIEAPAWPAALLRQIGTPPSWSADEPPAVLLAPLYRAAGALARDFALRPSDAAAPRQTEPPRAARDRSDGRSGDRQSR